MGEMVNGLHKCVTLSSLRQVLPVSVKTPVDYRSSLSIFPFFIFFIKEVINLLFEKTFQSYQSRLADLEAFLTRRMSFHLRFCTISSAASSCFNLWCKTSSTWIVDEFCLVFINT